MPAEQNNAQEIGVVTGISGDAYAQSASGMRVLEPGSPIYRGEELITGDDGNIEVRFVDDTLISQGGNSRISIDDYVYEPEASVASYDGTSGGGSGEYFIYAEDTDKLYYDADGTGTAHEGQLIASFDSDVTLNLGTNLIVS